MTNPVRIGSIAGAVCVASWVGLGYAWLVWLSARRAVTEYATSPVRAAS